MHDHRALVEDRVERTLRQRLRPAVHRVVGALDVTAWHVAGEPVPPAEALRSGDGGPAYLPFTVGDRWGPPWTTTWFHLTGTVPQEAAGRRVELVVDLGWADHSTGFQAEGLAYRPDGTVLKGLHPRNAWLPVTGPAVDVYVEAAANPLILEVPPFQPTPYGDRDTAGDAPLYRLARADVAVFEEAVWELVQDLEVLDQLARELPDGDPRGHEIRRALDRALDLVDPDDVAGSAPAARSALAGAYATRAHASAHHLSAVGHAHIDSAWLWPLRETVRKVARTASNVVDLLDSDPDLVFAMSSAQQLAWIEEHRPEVFARVAAHVQGGRFVPVGGMWVESDTNLPGSESMARQLVHGKRWFLDRFGVETREVWLPDSFGYSAALPQLVALSGSRWFLTQKISWNQSNRFPHHSFWWEGIDGTRIFTHFPPVDTYNAELSGAELAHAVRTFRDKGPASRSLVPFGYGDGGGGPTREMLARARRVADLEGSPRVTIEPPAAFFAAAEREYGAEAPVWVGELYLELHRATYTSQAKTKQGNRRSEHLLREAELWCATAAVRSGYDYPNAKLDRIWKTVLLHQFHDILPGSSIAWVHREARETYARVAAELEEVVGEAQRALAGSGIGAVDFNPGPFARDGVPALGASLVDDPPAAAGGEDTARASGEGFVLDNGLLRVAVDGRGLVISVRDLVARREVLPLDRVANLLQLHRDLPNRWDAWDVDRFYRHAVTDLVDADSVSLVDGDTVRVVRRFGRSRATQDVTLAPGARRLDFRTEVDWHEREKFLKAAFPLDVHTDRAAFETQYGHVVRPTHENTSWDAARFEVCGHRWVHVGEAGYGVAVANDSTYGYDVRREPRTGGGTSTTLRLSLLRAPRFPDPETDQGTHTVRYALVPGATVADAVAAGYAMNLPVRRVPGGTAIPPLIRIEPAPPEVVAAPAAGGGAAHAVVVEAVKLADDGSGDVVVRLYESLGGRATARLVADFPTIAVAETDLLERPVANSALTTAEPPAPTLTLRPFQVVTLRFTR